MKNDRALSASILEKFFKEKKPLSTYFIACSPFVKEICYGVLRWYFKLKSIADSLLKKPLKNKDQDVYFLLLVGLYQILYLNTPVYAAVSETVNATLELKKPWARGLINKLLRLFIDMKETHLTFIEKNSESLYAHPNWLIEVIKKDWPTDWEFILKNNNEKPPLFLRINLSNISRENFINLLRQQNIAIIETNSLPETIQLQEPLSVEKIPGFYEGLFYVQDMAGQYAAHLLDIKPGHSVLDACAAPGSKTTHLLQLQSKLKKLIAIDQDPLRLTMIKDNIARLKLNDQSAHLICADAGKTDDWHSGELFDRILLDPPCSATGIIRRHPDIKILRQPEDIKQHHHTQTDLLESLWPLLKENGILLYSTCSILSKENDAVIKAFLLNHSDASIENIHVQNAIPTQYGQQLLPSFFGADGFYYAKLVKTPPLRHPHEKGRL